MSLNHWCLLMSMSALFSTKTFAAEPARPSPKSQAGMLGRDVNPFSGTGGVSYLCANNFPGASVPFGFVRLSPDTVSLAGKRATNSSGYYYSDPTLLGFSHTRLVGTGATDGGNFLVIPTSESESKSMRRGMHASYVHKDEVAFPGYYSVVLPRNHLTAELTASRRVGVHRYSFANERHPHILVHVTSALGKGRCQGGETRILPEKQEIEGSVTYFGTFSSRYGGLKLHFVGRFNRPFQHYAAWSGNDDGQGKAQAAGDDIGVDLGFDSDDSNPAIELKLALSSVSIDNARDNLEQETKQKDFEGVLADAIAQWEEKLSRLQVSGGTNRQRRIFRTALYRSLQMPTAFNDANGEYIGFDKQVHKVDGFEYYTDLSLWDTFRTVHPLYTLIAPREQRDMVVSLVTMAKQGGYLPRWPSGTGYTGSMFGSPADMVITESYLKGIRDFDAEAALEYMKKTALAPVPQGAPFSGRVGIEHYLKHQYCPADLMKKSVASTIEYCYADHSIARLAEALGKTDDAKLFYQHAAYYRNLFNPETQFFQPRNANGQFSADFAPEMMTYLDFGGKLTHAYVEGSAWQWRWGVPSDADETVKLFKSPAYFVQELNQFFEKAPAGVSVNPNAFYWQGNQPDIYAAYLFNFAGRPDLTQKWARWILDSKYNDLETGLDGNDDGGTLSAWYVFSSLGLYPTAGTDRYEIGSPIWSQAVIQLGDKPLKIQVENPSTDNVYVQRVWLDDKPLDRHWVTHAELQACQTLRFQMGNSPATSFNH